MKRRKILTVLPGAGCALGVLGCTRGEFAQILLFAGAGTSPGSVAALEKILRMERLGYAAVDSAKMHAMSTAQLAAYRLLIVPGGNFEVLGKNLTPETTARLREAIGSGLHYLGICAGAFFAGNTPYNGLNLTGGRHFPFYSAEWQGIRKAALQVTTAAGDSFDPYWEDGPELSGRGEVVGKYPDGTPAIVQGMYGRGRVILIGVHAEADASWRNGMSFRAPPEVANAYAVKLIHAALAGEKLADY